MEAMRTVYAKKQVSNYLSGKRYGRHTIIVKGKYALFAKNILFRWIVW